MKGRRHWGLRWISYKAKVGYNHPENKSQAKKEETLIKRVSCNRSPHNPEFCELCCYITVSLAVF